MASTSQDTQMKKDAEIGCHVQIIDNNLLEFDVKTVSDAVWMFVSQEGMKSVCYHHEVRWVYWKLFCCEQTCANLLTLSGTF